MTVAIGLDSRVRVKRTDGAVLKGCPDKDRSSTQSNILMDLYNGTISEWSLSH
jgi:hypothetical protein